MLSILGLILEKIRDSTRSIKKLKLDGKKSLDSPKLYSLTETGNATESETMKKTPSHLSDLHHDSNKMISFENNIKALRSTNGSVDWLITLMNDFKNEKRNASNANMNYRIMKQKYKDLKSLCNKLIIGINELSLKIIDLKNDFINCRQYTKNTIGDNFTILQSKLSAIFFTSMK